VIAWRPRRRKWAREAKNARETRRTLLETEIARLQGENATRKKELLARALPVPGVPRPPAGRPTEPELKLPSDAEVDKVMSFLEKVWRRLLEMGREVQKDVERKN
ncbi:MAG TPA: hypothetical protein VE200_13225, partial [Xanthobacteraceae bacterium]|nr:hypothetical protein [Xanthobacteraceae bacterium]